MKRVYFIRPIGQLGPIKIGLSIDPVRRLADLEGCSPFRLEIVASMPGDHLLERRLHEAFRSLHSHGEWFLPGIDLLAAVDAIRAGTFDATGLPAPGYPVWYDFTVRRGRTAKAAA